MKIFTEQNGSFRNKVNFIDKNNTIVGYDLSQSCCEHADWYISESPFVIKEEGENLNQILENEDVWKFDVSFFYQGESYSEGGHAVFKLVDRRQCPQKEKYLHIFNHHNGYYSHGFEMTQETNWKTNKNEILHQGSL